MSTALEAAGHPAPTMEPSFSSSPLVGATGPQRTRQPFFSSSPSPGAAGTQQCQGCGGHCRNCRQKCKAWATDCKACGKTGHLAEFCYSRQTLNTTDTKDLDAAGLETLALQSCSPPEYRGLSPGAEAPVLPAVFAQLTLSPTRPPSSCSCPSSVQALAVKTRPDS